MGRSSFTLDKGLEHLSEQDKSSVRSFAYRLRCLICKKNFKIKNLSRKDILRFLLYSESVKMCMRTKKDWKECTKICKGKLKERESFTLESKQAVRDFIKDFENGKGFSRFK